MEIVNNTTRNTPKRKPSRNTKLDHRVILLEAEVVILKSQQLAQDNVLNKLDKGFEDLNKIVQRGVGAVVILSPLLAFIGSILADKF